MELMTAEYKPSRCPKCGGTGSLPHYYHHQAGVCFKCGGTGQGKPVRLERHMADDEVIAALQARGIHVVYTIPTDFYRVFTDEAYAAADLAAQRQAMEGARALLAIAMQHDLT